MSLVSIVKDDKELSSTYGKEKLPKTFQEMQRHRHRLRVTSSFMLHGITTICPFLIANITNRTHWRVSIFVHKSSVSSLIMAFSFLFLRSWIIVLFIPSSLSLGNLFTSIFCKAHLMQSIASCISWLNLGMCAGWICFFLLAIFACKNWVCLNPNQSL